MTMRKDSPLYRWLQTQPEEFVKNVLDNGDVRHGILTIDQLRELDEYFNPEDEE